MAFLDIDESTPGLVTWTLNRPERANAIGTSLAAALVTAASALAARTEPPAVLVIRAKARPTTKGSVWVAGGDLKELTELPTGAAVRGYAGAMSQLGTTLESLPTIVIAAVDGAAIGGGAELVLMADVRLMTKDARFEWKQTKVGLATGYGTAKRLVDTVGLGVAQGLLYGARTVDADAALTLGLAHAVYADGAALTAGVTTWVQDLLATGRAPLAAQKAMLRQACQGHPGAARAAELSVFTQLWRNPSHSQFLAAFAARKDSP